MTNNSALRTPRPGSLYDVLDLILDKGLVIDAYVRVSLVGIELLTVDARVVVASVDTYLRFAEATNRLDLAVQNGTGLPELIGDLQQGGARHKTKGAIDGAKESVSHLFGGGDEDSDEDRRDGDRRGRERQPARRSSRRSSRDDNGDRSSRSERRGGSDDDSANESEGDEE